MNLYEIIIRKLVQLPNLFFQILFAVAYPIYAWTHRKRAWQRVRHLLNILPKNKQVSVRCVFKSLFFNMIDALRFLSGASNAPKVYFENEDKIKNCLLQNKPLVLVGIHQGAFEILHRSLLRYSPTVHLFTSTLRNRPLNDAMRAIRFHKGLCEHDIGDVGKVFKQLFKENGLLSLAVDQATGNGNPVKIFNCETTLFLRIPIKCMEHGATILTFRTYRLSATEHVVRFETVYNPQVEPFLKATDFSKILPQKIAAEMECWLSEHPEQWTWNYHRNFTR